jgi:hypothetical protein
VGEYIYMTVRGQARVTYPHAVTTVALKPCVYRHVFCTSAACYVVEQYFQSQSYFKRKDDFKSAFPKYQVPNKSTVFRVVTRFRGTGSVGDGKLSGRPTVLNDVSVDKDPTIFSANSAKIFNM